MEPDLLAAVRTFAGAIRGDFVLAQVSIRVVAGGFELRHVNDRCSSEKSLRAVDAGGVREIAQVTARGVFRPLKSSPTLAGGWRLTAGSLAELELAVNQVYPGALADWFAVSSGQGRPVAYEEFSGRQTGMYRITGMLSARQAEAVARAGCAVTVCLKRRLWTVGEAGPEPAACKSVIPCLEPCALLLEFARKAMRLEQAVHRPMNITDEELETVRAALDRVLLHRDQVREGEMNDPLNPRRVNLLLEKLTPAPLANPGGEGGTGG